MLVYLDGILVAGASEEEHTYNLMKVLSRLQEAGLRLHRDKCEFIVLTVQYLGHLINASGLRPSNKKLKATVFGSLN